MVVVGAGNAAMCAAITAREVGKRVLVLERAPRRQRGGNSWFTDGAMRFAHNGIENVRTLLPHMRDKEADRIELPPYPESEFLSDLHRMSDGRADETLSRVLAQESFQSMAWLRDRGVLFAMLYENQSFETSGRYRFWGGLAVKVEGKGVGLIEALSRRVDELGVEVLYDAPLINLNRVRDSWIVGVAHRGQNQSVETPAVVLACGGFQANREMRTQYLGQEWDGAIVRGTGHNTGVGLRIALAQGAARHGDWSGCHAIATDSNAPPVGDYEFPGDVFKKHSYPLGIVVNVNGVRFVDEGADFRNYTYARYGHEVLRQPRGIAYQIFDAQVIDRLREEYRLPDATKFEADTLDQLASQLDIDAPAFLATVRQYNQAVRDDPYNPDRLDGKGTQGVTPPKTNWALRIEAPPFVAYPVRCGITFTFGGIRINEHAQVLRDDRSIIPGLYAAGEIVGGLFYGNYPGGAGLTSGSTFGRMAGAHASRFRERRSADP